ncbi:MAG TPA: MerR family transcriptional regulator [Candidatus Sulfomarinibacteraceae bacterium]|nr:MerR family transcriptional regulator [Candidatus Sulfomarinibacteraceae bacterium]
MFKIGEFSRFSRVSVKMLRHYDRLGLLQPAHVDPFTGYRYYTADQLPRLQRIIALKDLGFSLEQIDSLLDEELSTDEVRGMLKLRRAEIQASLHQEEERLARIEARLAHLEETERLPAYEVVLRPVAGQRVASIQQQVGQGVGVPALFEELEAYVARYDGRAARPPLLLYHDAQYEDAGQEVEVVVPLNRPVPQSDRVRIWELPGYKTVACVVHTGDYNSLPNAFTALLRWIEQHRYRIIDCLREAYLRFGADQEEYTLPPVYLTDRASELVTELQIPVRKP